MIVECLIEGSGTAQGKLEIGVQIRATSGRIINAIRCVQDESEIETSPSKAPEQLRAGLFRHLNDGGVGQHESDRKETIGHQAIKALKAPNASTQGSANHSDARSTSNSYSVGLG